MTDSTSRREAGPDADALFREMCAPKYSLREWLDDLHNNHNRNLAASPEFYERAQRIDGLFQSLITGCRLTLLDIHNDVVFFLIGRAHSSFLSSMVLSLNGQLAEAHMVMRGCIEASLYALQVRHTPTLGEVWSERERSADAKRAARQAFTIKRAFEVLNQDRRLIAAHVHKLYEDTIANGAHPNIGAVVVSMALVKEPEERGRLAILYLGGPANPLFIGCLQRVLRVGCAAIDILSGMYADELADLRLRQEVHASAWASNLLDSPAAAAARQRPR